MTLTSTSPHRFPHPVTLGGMFEMGKSYLPVNENWFKYIASSNAKYEELQDKGKELLTGLVEEARLKFDDERQVSTFVHSFVRSFAWH